MAEKIKQDALGIEICEALGVSPSLITEIAIDLYAGKVPIITIEMRDFDGKLEAIDWKEGLKQAEVTVNITKVTLDA